MKVLVASSKVAERLDEYTFPEGIEIVSPENGTDEEMIALAQEAEIIVCTRLSPAAAAVRN